MANETITPAAGVAAGAGVVDSRTQRVVHPTDDPIVSGIGTTLDTVVGDNTTVAASATAASGISLWKRIVNLLIAVLAKLPLVGTAGTASANVITVQGIASGTTLPVTEASGAAIKTAVEKPTASSTSVLYTGNGTTGNELQDNQAACALLETADHVAAVISVGANNILEAFVTNATAAETITVSVREYSAATPTLATMIRAIPVSLGSDQAQTVDRSCVGLGAGTVHYAKTPVRIAVTPNSYITLAIIENITGLAYCRYQLKGAL